MGIETAILGSAALGAGAGLLGSRSASRAQTRAADQAAATQREMFERQVELQAPFREAGLTAQNRLMTLLGLEGGEAGAPDFGRAARDFSMADYTADPGYGFRMSEGMKALERSAAARGGLLSGATLKGTQRFGQDLASQEYQNAFNRFYTMRNAQLNPLQGILGQGQSSTNVLTGAAGDVGRGVGAAQMGAGQARASGYAAGTNALTGALQSGMGNYLTASYLARMPGPGVNAYASQPGTFYGPAGYGSGISQFDV
jgi:hypothetical protein